MISSLYPVVCSKCLLQEYFTACHVFIIQLFKQIGPISLISEL